MPKWRIRQRNSCPQQPGTVFTPAGVGSVGQDTYHRIDKRIENACDQQYHTCCCWLWFQTHLYRRRVGTSSSSGKSGSPNRHLSYNRFSRPSTLLSLCFHGTNLFFNFIWLFVWKTAWGNTLSQRLLSNGWISFHSPKSPFLIRGHFYFCIGYFCLHFPEFCPGSTPSFIFGWEGNPPVQSHRKAYQVGSNAVSNPQSIAVNKSLYSFLRDTSDSPWYQITPDTV